MFKNFLKNHPIHKNLSVKLDSLFIFRPTIYFCVWLILCIGMYIPLFRIDSNPIFISGLSFKTISLFFGISLLFAIVSIYYQLSKIDKDYIISEKYNKDYIYKIKNILLLVSFMFLLYSDYWTLIPSILILLIGMKMFKYSSYQDIVKFCSVIGLSLIHI